MIWILFEECKTCVRGLRFSKLRMGTGAVTWVGPCHTVDFSPQHSQPWLPRSAWNQARSDLANAAVSAGCSRARVLRGGGVTRLSKTRNQSVSCRVRVCGLSLPVTQPFYHSIEKNEVTAASRAERRPGCAHDCGWRQRCGRRKYHEYARGLLLDKQGRISSTSPAQKGGACGRATNAPSTCSQAHACS